MIEVKPTYGSALRIWWAMSWRFWAFCMPIIIALCTVSALILIVLMGMDGDQARAINGLIGMVIGAISGMGVILFVIKRMMIKGFGRYRLALVEK